MIIAHYETIDALRNEIGKPLQHVQDDMFNPEYRSNGSLQVCNNPALTGARREFFATITIENDILVAVD